MKLQALSIFFIMLNGTSVLRKHGIAIIMEQYLNELTLEIIALIFVVASGLVWIFGTRLSRYADVLAKKTGTSDVVIGSLLLGGVTSLPEVVTTITASTIGNPDIALNNLFGGVALQTTLLAAGDLLLKNKSISFSIESPVIRLQGIICILLLSVAISFILINDVAVIHIGVGSFLILILFIGGLFLVNYLQSIRWWKSDPDTRYNLKSVKKSIKDNETSADDSGPNEGDESFKSILRSKLLLYFMLSSLGVLAGGYTVVEAGQAIGVKTDLSNSFIGAIFIAVATSLPELSTTVSLVKLQQYRLAFSNIFGTNIYTIGFVFLADIFYREGPILNTGETFSLFGAALGIILTSIYLVGLSVRMGKSFLNMGYDSLLVLLFYLTGAVVMFNL